MNIGFSDQHWTDADGNPAGGVSYGVGFCISWQNGPLGRGPTRVPPNGAFVETILQAARSRLEFYQSSKFKSQHNADAIESIDQALRSLEARTRSREDRGVEGTHAT